MQEIYLLLGTAGILASIYYSVKAYNNKQNRVYSKEDIVLVLLPLVMSALMFILANNVEWHINETTAEFSEEPTTSIVGEYDDAADDT